MKVVEKNVSRKGQQHYTFKLHCLRVCMQFKDTLSRQNNNITKCENIIVKY